MQEDVRISYRGATYEIGRGSDFYGIWLNGAPRSQPSERWPQTPEGWHGAWSRFIGIEIPETITTVATPDRPVSENGHNPLIASGLLVIGVICGIVGLFPSYLDGANLAGQPVELVPHAVYFAVWTASALLLIVQRTPWDRVGALLGVGTSLVTFGLFFADAGVPIAGGAHLLGSGLILGLVGWTLCAAGSAWAVRRRPVGAPGKPPSYRIGLLWALVLASVGTAAAFAPSWDSFTLRTPGGLTTSLTAGNAFGNPAPVITGNLVTMLALVVVVVLAALWRPTFLGASLLAGAIIPMVAQAIAALVQLGEATSPSQFGFSAAEAARAGLTISSGLTFDFWIYCAFLVVLMVAGARMLTRGNLITLAAPRSSPELAIPQGHAT